MDIIKKPSLKEAISILSERDELGVIIEFLRDERDRFFGDLRQASDSNDVMKLAGSISTLDEIITLFAMNP